MLRFKLGTLQMSQVRGCRTYLSAIYQREDHLIGGYSVGCHLLWPVIKLQCNLNVQR